MKPYFVIVLVAMAWAGVHGNFTLANLLIGAFIGYGAVWLSRPVFGSQGGRALRRIPALFSLLGLFVWELLISSLRVAWDVLTPRSRAEPRIVAVPLTVRSDFEIFALANLISLTPGTLSLDVSDDRSLLYVHAMFAGEPEALVANIKGSFERRVLEVSQ
ncbi:MAG: Na+/H+ antiporter subunit E [Azospirillaceae bacterium]